MRVTCIECVGELGFRDERVVFVGSDVGSDTLCEFRGAHPNRFFVEGISEQFVIGMAAGLALDGFVPYVNSIGTFLTRRGLEQIVIDACLHQLPLRFLAYGGGLAYATLGPTHQSIEDFAVLRALPGMTVLAPCDAVEMRQLMLQTLDWPGPVYVRMSGGDEPRISCAENIRIGRGVLLREPGEVLIVTTGIMAHAAIQACDALVDHGVNAGVLHLHTVKPIDLEALLAASRNTSLVVSVEEHRRVGGLGSAVLEALADAGVRCRTLRLGLPDAFVDAYGTHSSVLRLYGLDGDGIVAAVLNEKHMSAGFE